MTGSSTTWSLGLATYAAALVEMVEALTIVLAMGLTRGWRSTLLGVAAALVALVVFTAAVGYAVTTWLPRSALQLVIGALLLVFGLQWLRKAILRSAGRKSMHDEEAIFERELTDARSAADAPSHGLDWFAFVVSFKGVFLEGVEVVFIVLTFGLNAHDVPVAAISAALALLSVLALALVVRGPLTRIPENTLKYAVALLLTSFGTFWSVEGLGVLTASHDSLTWPAHELVLPMLLLGWFLLSRLLVRLVRPSPRSAPVGG